MTDRELLRLIGETPEKDLEAALKTRKHMDAEFLQGENSMKNQKDTGNSGGKYCKHRKSYKTMLIAAVLAVSAVVGCVAAAVYYRNGLIEDLKLHSLQEAEGYEQLLVTAPQTEAPEGVKTSSEQVLVPLASAKDQTAEYQVLEAILDSESLYFHERIVPLQENVILIDQLVMPNDPVEMLENPELSGCTIQEYADSQGKKLMYARLVEHFDSDIINGWGMHAKTETDGSLHIYGSGQNPSSIKDLHISFEGFTHKPGDSGPFTDRTGFDLTLRDESTSNEIVYTKFRAYDPKSPDLEKDFGAVIDSLVMKKTELGIYATFNYHPTEQLQKKIDEEIAAAAKIKYEKGDTNEEGLPMEVACSPQYIRGKYVISFIMLDENGEYFKTTGPSGGRGVQQNPDGSYSVTYSMAHMENTDNLKFRVLTGDMDKVGTYAFSR